MAAGEGVQAELQRGFETGPGPKAPERDENYNLVSVLYHALQSAETCAQYIDDAREAEDEELADFFAEVRKEDISRACRAKEMLMERVQGGALRDRVEGGAERAGEPEGDEIDGD